MQYFQHYHACRSYLPLSIWIQYPARQSWMTIESFRLKIKWVKYLVSWYISFAHHFKNTKIYKYTKIYNCTLIRTPRSVCVCVCMYGNTPTAINLPHMQLLWHQKVFLGKKRDEEQHQPRKKIYPSFNINWFLFRRHSC